MTDTDKRDAPTYIDILRAASEGATRAPWYSTGFDDNPGDEGWGLNGGGVPGSPEERLVAACLPYSPNAEADHLLIALARNCFDELLGVVEAAQRVEASHFDYATGATVDLGSLNLAMAHMSNALTRLKAKVTDA